MRKNGFTLLEINNNSSTDYGNALKKRFLSLTGFNLLELILVVIILTILAGLMFPRYQRTMERAKDHEAITMLKAIKAGEKIYYLQYRRYWPNPDANTTNIKAIEENLGVSLTDKNWQIFVGSSRTVTGAPDFGAGATRKVPESSPYWRYWAIASGQLLPPPEPRCNAEDIGFACPPGSY